MTDINVVNDFYAYTKGCEITVFEKLSLFESELVRLKEENRQLKKKLEKYEEIRNAYCTALTLDIRDDVVLTWKKQ
jgi:cell shape-determining protein MreC